MVGQVVFPWMENGASESVWIFDGFSGSSTGVASTIVHSIGGLEAFLD